MPVPSAQAIFDLPFPNVKDIASVNRAIATPVQIITKRDLVIPRREVERTSGLVLSQYARVLGAGRLVLRSYDVDLALWFAAGISSAVELEIDSRVKIALATSNINLNGNIATVDSNSVPQTNSAILADRLDILNFVDVILQDISSGRNAFFILFDVLDVPARRLMAGARKVGISTEVLPSPHSYAIFQLDDPDGRGAFEALFRTYVQQTALTPNFLEQRSRGKNVIQSLSDAIREVMGWTWDALANANDKLGLKTVRPSKAQAPTSPSESLGRFIDEYCLIVNQSEGSVAALIGDEYRKNATTLRNELSALNKGIGESKQLAIIVLNFYRLLWQLCHLITSWNHHALSENETIRLSIDRWKRCSITPKGFKPFYEYAFFYRFNEFLHRQEEPGGKIRLIDRSKLGGPVDHVVRKWQLFALIEMLFTFLRRERPNETIRWLDLGCGAGNAANCVRVEDYLPDNNWEIVGIDWNKTALSAARRSARPNRTFLLGDVKEAVAHIGGGSFNIVSAFEFIEHLEDPVRTLKEYAPLCSDFFVAGSPLAEQQGWLPAPSHIWTFDREGYQATIEAAGWRTTFANEAHIGSFVTGYDWVTVIAGKNRSFAARI